LEDVCLNSNIKCKVTLQKGHLKSSNKVQS